MNLGIAYSLKKRNKVKGSMPASPESASIDPSMKMDAKKLALSVYENRKLSKGGEVETDDDLSLEDPEMDALDLDEDLDDEVETPAENPQDRRKAVIAQIMGSMASKR